MRSFDNSAIRICQPAVTSTSRRLRQAIRFLIGLACVATVILFLFYPPAAAWVTFPIPVAVVVFILLAGFEGVLRWFTRFRRSRRIGRKKLSGSRKPRRYSLLKYLAGLSLAVLLVDVVLYDEVTVYGIRPVPIAVAALLLLVTISPSPAFGFFICETESDRMSRLQRQTYYSMLSALDTGVYQPLSRDEVELEDAGEPDEYQLVAFPTSGDAKDELLVEGQNGWEDDIECNVAGELAAPRKKRVHILPR